MQALGGRFAYWYSPELHPGGHGWHVNFFVALRLEHAVVASVWGRGFVWVTDFASAPRAPKGEPLGLCRTPREGWRRAARYGCKYAQKDWCVEHVGQDSHRYEVAQGFAPRKQSAWVCRKSDAELVLSEVLPLYQDKRLQVWDSADQPDWGRPPVKIWRW